MSALIDELARSLARPMPRRTALRLVAGSLAGLAVAGVRPRWAFAQNCGPGAQECGGSSLDCYRPGRDTCCPYRPPADPLGSDVLFDVPNGVCCYDERGNANPVLPGWQCCSDGHACAPGVECCSTFCCQRGEYCANPTSGVCCKRGESLCRNSCCRVNEECFGTGSARRCIPKCPQGRARCGPDKCCPRGRRCANPRTGICKPCRDDQEACERKCCNRRTTRCCGKAGCCPNGRFCCNTANGRACCPPEHKCRTPILRGNIGVLPGTPPICCPPERVNSNPDLCCPRGMVALNTRGFRIPPPGIPPDCCPPSQIRNGVCTP